MSVFSQELVFTDASDAPSSGWLVLLGIVLLVGTVFQELVGISMQVPLGLASGGATLLSIYPMI